MAMRKSSIMILSGLLCVASALTLTAYNLLTERAAGLTAKETMVTISETVVKHQPADPAACAARLLYSCFGRSRLQPWAV